jgi:hypothetical protein
MMHAEDRHRRDAVAIIDKILAGPKTPGAINDLLAAWPIHVLSVPPYLNVFRYLTGPYRDANKAKLVRQVEAELTGLRETLTDPEPTRPEKPTADYCLPGGLTARWEGEVELSPVSQRALDFLLSRGNDFPCPADELATAVWGENSIPSSRKLSNAISRLNDSLEEIEFPYRYRTRNSQVIRRPR